MNEEAHLCCVFQQLNHLQGIYPGINFGTLVAKE